MYPHVTHEVTLLPQHLATHITCEFVLQKHLVVDSKVAVLGRLPSMIGAKVALPLLLWVVFELYNVGKNMLWYILLIVEYCLNSKQSQTPS